MAQAQPGKDWATSRAMAAQASKEVALRRVSCAPNPTDRRKPSSTRSSARSGREASRGASDAAAALLAQTARGNITLGTDHGFKHGAVLGFYQLGDLPANTFERQTAAGREALDLCGTCKNHHRRLGQQFVVLAGLPLVIDPVQLQHVMVRQHVHIGV